MFSFRESRLTKRITHIADPTGVACFFVKGDERALLIDTGVGFRGLKQKAEALSGLPCDVLLTHGHADHAGGAGEFSAAHLSDLDISLAKRHCTLESRMGYARFSLPSAQTICADDFVQDEPEHVLPLRDGQIFDLGGVTVEAIALPGHTQGSMCVLFREERAMLYGDACNANTFLFDESSSTVSAYLESLTRFKQWDDAYDTVLYSHGPATGPRQCLDDNIELCRRILAGQDDAIPASFMGQPAWRAAACDDQYRRLDGKFGNILYHKDRL